MRRKVYTPTQPITLEINRLNINFLAKAIFLWHLSFAFLVELLENLFSSEKLRLPDKLVAWDTKLLISIITNYYHKLWCVLIWKSHNRKLFHWHSRKVNCQISTNSNIFVMIPCIPVCTENILKTQLFESDDVRIINHVSSLPWSVPQTNPK